MATATQLFNMENLVPYLGDGAESVFRAVVAALPRHAKLGDNVKLYAATAVHTIVALDASTGAYPLAVIAKSNGTACTVCIYKADDATVGTDDSWCVPVSGTSGEISASILLGAGPYRLWATDGSGIGIAAPATTQGTGAVANDPDVFVIYVDA